MGWIFISGFGVKASSFSFHASIMLGFVLEDQYNARNFFVIVDEMALAGSHIEYDVSHMSVSSAPVC